jgi:cytochrome c-type biogenesis protein CcmH
VKRFLIILLGCFALSVTAQAAIDVFEFDNEQQEEQFKELSNTLRCPKCQNNTIADSNAELAQDLRQKVYEMTKEGKDSDEIVDYMIARYGNFVTYKPPFTLATSVLWIGPLLVVLLGFALIVMKGRKKKAVAEPEREWDEEKEARLKALLEQDEDGDKQK